MNAFIDLPELEITDCPELVEARELEGPNGRGMLLRHWDLFHATEAHLLGEARAVLLGPTFPAHWDKVEQSLKVLSDQQAALLDRACRKQAVPCVVPEIGKKGGEAAMRRAAGDMLLHRAITAHERQARARAKLTVLVETGLVARMHRHAEITGAPPGQVVERALAEYLKREEAGKR